MLLSLWDLPDRPTRDWVELFYRNFLQADFTPATALRIAFTESLLSRRSLGRSTHPFYWGGFIVIGDVD